jgi:predicted O-methyltransferase YrrM
LNTEHLYLLTELQGQQTDGYFDLVLLDLNFVEVRKDYIDYTARILAADGAVIVDDVHKVEFLREVKRIARMAGCRLYDIRKATYDGFGRFSIVMKR